MSKFIDLTGKRFNRLTVIKRMPNKKNITMWLCRCDCGKEIISSGGHLKDGHTKSCGCYKTEVITNVHPVNLLGKRFGRLVVIKKLPSKKRKRQWLCKCDCGNETVLPTGALDNGSVRSCGCLHNELLSERQTTHGRTVGGKSDKTYRCWQGIKRRCLNKNNPSYKNYGGRGIKVCDRWINSFENFLEDMGESPQDMSIDRIDVNSDYCPENCRWASVKTQANNTTQNVYLKYNGQQHTIAQWVSLLHVDYQKFYRMLHTNRSIEQVFEEMKHCQTQ